jgi:DNA-directed RNA polymerase specialized sigma24 family protein
MELTLNEKIERDMKDQDLVRIMNKASMSFSKQLSLDEIETCHINAMWKAHQHYNPKFGTLFLTYLYKGVQIECLRELKFKQKNAEFKGIHSNISDKKDYSFNIELEEEIDLLPNKQMIKDKLSGLSVKEIAGKFGLNRETTRRKIKKSLARLAMRMK